jgi:hypothetical protein
MSNAANQEERRKGDNAGHEPRIFVIEEIE